MKNIKKITLFMICLSFFVLVFQGVVKASLVNTADNDMFRQNSIPEGRTGKLMNISFTYTAERDYEKAFIGIAYDRDLNSSVEEEKAGANTFPFEASAETFKRKEIGKIKQGQKRHVSLSARVRKDMPEGYYSIRVYVADAKEGGSLSEQEYINVWVRKSVDTDKSEEIKTVNFSLGEGQSTPRGVYPNVMNFSLNLKNRGKVTAQNVVVSMQMDKDNAIFPFEINDVNYDRHFEKISHDETAVLEYSFAIRKDAYTGYYPLKLNISYQEVSDGPIKTVEQQFFVYVTAKEREDASSGDFNINNRTKARIIVDSFRTEPEKVFAGEHFDLILKLKNASSSVAASNILFSFESEKVAESPVFSLENGANSRVVNSLKAGEDIELRLKMLSKPSIDQKSYVVKINQKFDSKEFKNAEETITIDIPVYQVAKVKLGNFELVPESVNVDEDINVTFPINNTGKVTLYNVTARFDADFIKKNEYYIGNIKPGETGNVDATLTPTAVNNEKETKLVLTYEDDAGNVSTLEQNILIPITENFMDDSNMFTDINMNQVEKKGTNIFVKIIRVIIFLAVILVVILLVRKFIAKRKNGVK